MNKKDKVEIVDVPPMTVASFHAYGPSPEHLALESMKIWLAANGVATGAPPGRVFGFNNPNPDSGSPNYGYEFWMELREGSPLAAAAQKQGVVIKSFPGGRYAGLHHEGTGEAIPGTWKELVRLLTGAGHGHANHQWLEEHYLDLGSDNVVLSLDCLAPIK